MCREELPEQSGRITEKGLNQSTKQGQGKPNGSGAVTRLAGAGFSEAGRWLDVRPVRFDGNRHFKVRSLQPAKGPFLTDGNIS